jgi:hypothetical protein
MNLPALKGGVLDPTANKERTEFYDKIPFFFALVAVAV